MQMMKWSVIALAVAAGTSQMALASSQSDSKGFVEDSSLNILSRNLYINRDYHRGGSAANYEVTESANPAGYTAEWGQGFIGTFESGFTEGTVGFGADAYGLLGIKLDSGKGRAGILEMQQDHDGRTSDEYGEAGAAVKVRVSNSVLKYGDQFVALPVFSTDDSRLLPEATTGTLLTSTEIEGLEINAGRFTALNQQWETNRDSSGMESINVLGGSYSFTDELSVSLYGSDLEDAFQKAYANVNFTLPLADERSLNFDFNLYNTDYEKDYVQAATTVEEDDGTITDPGVRENRENTIWSLAAGYTFGAHTLTLAHQRSTGDTGYMYGGYRDSTKDSGIGDGGNTILLANSFWSDFNGKDERSWQAGYGIDFSTFGVPGLSYNIAYVRGTNIDDGSNRGDGTEREIFNQFKYVVQSGPAKDLSLRARASWLRVSTNANNYNVGGNEIRLFADYPINVF